jgi:membrane protein
LSDSKTIAKPNKRFPGYHNFIFVKIIKIFYHTILSFFRKDMLRNSAALAYYALFSLPAVLFIMIRVSDIYIDPLKASRYIYGEIGRLIGTKAAQSLRETVNQIEFTEDSTWKVVLSVIILVFTATNIFSTLQNSFNNIFEVTTKTEGWTSIIQLVTKRILSIGILLGFVTILLISLVLDMALTALSSRILDYVSGNEWLAILLGSIIIPVVVLAALFTLLFKTLPDVKLKTSDVLAASLLTSILYLGGKFGIGFYLGSTKTYDIYPSASAIVAILIWSYYSSAVILFGCTFLKEKLTAEGRDFSTQS